MPDAIEIKVTEIEQRCKANTKRIGKLEEEQEALRSIATSVAVMASEQRSISQKVDAIDTKVDKLEKIPAGRWNGLVEKIIFGAVGAAVAWLAAMVLR